ncbi:hypothetical protein VTH06DRAFT_2727 [Thermothelomyces fergusii]
MPIRNPFARRAAAAVQDENQRPGSAAAAAGSVTAAGFERVDTVGSKASASAFGIRAGGRRSYDTGEYKMSVVNDSGVYLPPSPVEREASWPRRYLSRTSSGRSSNLTRGDSGELDQFPISRESFDSYRRSFEDICARSPVVHPTTTNARQSLDSATFRPPRLPPRSPLGDQQQRRWRAGGPPTPEEEEEDEKQKEEGAAAFEDVGLGDQDGRPYNNNHSSSSNSSRSYGSGSSSGEERASSFFSSPFSRDRDAAAVPRTPHTPAAPHARKRGFFFGRFGGDADGGPSDDRSAGAGAGTVVSRLLPALISGGGGSRRAQSGGGQGAELRVMPALSPLDGPKEVEV